VSLLKQHHSGNDVLRARPPIGVKRSDILN